MRKSLTEFTWKHSETATDSPLELSPDMPSAITALLAKHTRSKVITGFKQATGGVLPVCVDEARQAWCLLGENRRAELCHFHG